MTGRGIGRTISYGPNRVPAARDMMPIVTPRGRSCIGVIFCDVTETRRAFLRNTVAAGLATTAASAQQDRSLPWYRRTYRWGQTNITEKDPEQYDIAWWRQYWRRTCVQGVIINAGGIYAYYPSKFPLHHRAAGLGDRDLYGDLAFPLQLTILLSEPGTDFTGGEFVLTEQRPRMQSRPEVVPLRQGDAVIFAVQHRPVQGSRGVYRVNMRHGVSRVRRGHRQTLGIIFHDAQ